MLIMQPALGSFLEGASSDSLHAILQPHPCGWPRLVGKGSDGQGCMHCTFLHTFLSSRLTLQRDEICIDDRMRDKPWPMA
jgi:hypothetical protein